MGHSATRSVLGDYFSLQRGKTYKSKMLDHPGPVLLGLASIARNGGFRSDSLRTYGGDSPDNLLVYPGDLYVSLKDVTQSGDLLGSVARLPDTFPVGRLSQDTVKLQPLSDDVPKSYLYWLMRTPQYRSYCRSHATGTTNLGLSREDFLSFPAPEPTVAQQTIVDTLESVEHKIATNHKMNQVLSTMARATFRSWFIDFEPVKAKVDGKTSFRGMPQDIFEQLPDQIHQTDHGQTPRGWGYVPIGEMVDVVGGGTPSTKNPVYWEDGDNPFCTPKDMSKLNAPVLLDTERHVTQAGVDKISSGQLPVGTVLLSSRAPIGYLALAATPVSVNQGIIAMHTGQIPNTYVLLWTEANMDVIKSRAGGSTFAEISKRNFRPIPALRPDDQTLRAFGDFATPLFEMITANERESQVLAHIRDALLPKLMSGEIRLNEDGEARHGG